MVKLWADIQRYFRWTMLGLTVLGVVAAFGSDTNARSRVHRPHNRLVRENYQPATASIVIDANSGAVMEEANADSPRHPASLTKIMTLYLLFEALEAGKLKMANELSVSTHAAEQAPSKLGLMPGGSIRADAAIRAIVAKSANDVAVIVAEAISGNESNFAKMMTIKARSLGMMRTTYNNASGLPDDLQVTTARDQAILARAIHDRFPQYYHYFSTPSFEFRGVTMRNHNHLLGRIPGVDGMKTGYIHASGYNIVTSAQRGKRRIIAVVFGGRTAHERDARAISLVENHIQLASVSVKNSNPYMVKSGVTASAQPIRKSQAFEQKSAVIPKPLTDPHPQTLSASSSQDEPSVGSNQPITPNPVKTVMVHLTTIPSSLPLGEPESVKSGFMGSASAGSLTIVNVAPVKLPPPTDSEPKILDLQATKITPSVNDDNSAHQDDDAAHQSAKPKIPDTVAKARSGWMIQIGAFDDENEAKQHLKSAQNKAKSFLGNADPFTERVSKGEKAFYRARFAGLDKDRAQTACKHLKRSDIPCMMLRN